MEILDIIFVKLQTQILLLRKYVAVNQETNKDMAENIKRIDNNLLKLNTIHQSGD